PLVAKPALGRRQRAAYFGRDELERRVFRGRHDQVSHETSAANDDPQLVAGRVAPQNFLNTALRGDGLSIHRENLIVLVEARGIRGGVFNRWAGDARGASIEIQIARADPGTPLTAPAKQYPRLAPHRFVIDDVT